MRLVDEMGAVIDKVCSQIMTARQVYRPNIVGLQLTVFRVMMMKLPILPCAEKLELVLCTAPKHEITPTKTVKTENGPISRGSQFEVSMVRYLWGKRFTKKVSF